MNYLFIGAHLDDVELAAGGTIAKLNADGHKIKMLILSKSDYVDIYGNLRSKEVAMTEGYEAAQILGVELEVLDFPTKDINFDSIVVTAIEKVIYDFKADAIFTHNVNDTHQAHVATAQASIAAARYINSIYFYEPIYPSGRAPISFNPQIFSDISDYLDLKVSSLKAHKSQYEKYKDEWIDAVVARAKFRGFESNMKYAECFELCRMEFIS
jgi:LmbE family N-acetylglucosaminyl deacetylase